MKCPICQFPELKDGYKNCPQCESDIEIFELINNSKRSLKKRNYLMIIVLLCFIISLLIIAYISNSYKISIDNKELIIAELIKEKDNIYDSLKYANQTKINNSVYDEYVEINDNNFHKSGENIYTSEKVSQDYIDYIVEKGDNLWSIALKFYNNGFKYQKIVEDNYIDNPETIIEGTVLKIYN